MTPVWVRELADAFWERVRSEPYPRTLAGVSLGLPVTVVERPRLSIGVVREWLAVRRAGLVVPGPDRPLRGCLVAHGWDGLVFVDAADDPAERRFTLAHELAHYVRDVWYARRRVATKLGSGILDVLDGRRLPTADERLHALLRNLPAGPVVHLLGRGPDESAEVRAAEAAADRLAFELLAPAAAVADVVGRSELTARLVCAYGLPAGPAGRYAALLVAEPAPVDRPLGRLLGR